MGEGNSELNKTERSSVTFLYKISDKLYEVSLSASFPSRKQDNLKFLVPIQLHGKFKTILHHMIFVIVILIVNLTRFIVTMETCPHVYLWGYFQKGLTEEESPTLNVGCGSRLNKKNKLNININFCFPMEHAMWSVASRYYKREAKMNPLSHHCSQDHLGRGTLIWGNASIKLVCADAMGGAFSTANWCRMAQPTVSSTILR